MKNSIKVKKRAKHMRQVQNSEITQGYLVNNTKVLRIEPDFNRLQIFEAFCIQQLSPTLNQQNAGFQRTLKVHNMPLSQSCESAAIYIIGE